MNWDDVATVYSSALNEPEDRRAAFLNDACAGRPDLRAELDSLLAAAPSASSGWLAEWSADPDRADPTDPAERTSALEAEGEHHRIGERVGAFRLVRLLGRGGMGEVFLAEREEPEFGQQVAIKLLPAGSASLASEGRFLQERRILASLRHPGIATLIDGGTAADGRPFLALEYVNGEPLTEYCDRVRAPLAQRLRLFATVCDIVQYAHSQLVVHRDLKPSNLLVTADGAVKLLDFGIAKLLEPAQPAGDTDPTVVLTAAETRLFTPLRAAPEQLRGETISVATDIYALGLLLFELLSGRLPFRGSIRDRWEAERVVREGDLMSLREAAAAESALAEPARLRATTPTALKRALSGDLGHVVHKALERAPEKRYESARALGDEVGRWLAHQPVAAHPPSWGYRARTFTRRHRVAVVLTAAIALSLLSTAAVSWVQSHRLERERNAARAGEERAHAAMATLLQVLAEVDPATPSGDDRITAEELLERAEREARRSPVPDVAARLLLTLGKLQHTRGHFPEAERCLSEALRRSSEIDAIDPIDPIAEIDSELLDEAEFARARVLVELGRPREAARLFAQRTASRKKALGAEHPSVLEAETEEANLLPPVQAAPRLRTLLDRRRRTAPRDLLAEATLLDYLGTALNQMGNRSSAREAWQEAFALLGVERGSEDLRILAVLDNLSMTAEDPAAAEEIQRSRIEIATRRVGPDSTVTAISWNNLAVALALQGRYAEAEQAARQAWRIFELRLGPRHLETANTLRNIGRMQQLAGRYADALATLRAARRGFGGLEEIPRGAVFVDAQVARVEWLVDRDRRAIADLEAAARSLAASSVDSEDRYPADAFHHLGLSQLESGKACAAARTLTETLDLRARNGDAENGRGLETRCALTLARQDCPTAESNPTEFASACAAQPSWGLADPELVKRARGRALNPFPASSSASAFTSGAN